MQAMRPEPQHRIDERAISLWRVHGIFGPVFWGVTGTMFLFVMSMATSVVKWWFIPAFYPVILLYAVGTILVIPPLRWKYWRYEVDDSELYLQRGFLLIRRTVIPLVRVQHVDTTQGPISKYFGLSAVRVSTAASTHEIPALSDEVADDLRDRISRLAREAREQL